MEKIEPVLIKSFILLNEYFQKENIRYCLIGGIAAGFWGEPRYTRDMDFVIVSQTRSLESIRKKLKNDGFKSVEKRASQLQITQKGELTFQADVILAELDYQDWVVQRAKMIPMFGVSVPICSPEDLIILKLIANRRQDLLDIENVLKNHFKNLDFKYLKQWFEFWDLTERFQKEFSEYQF